MTKAKLITKSKYQRIIMSVFAGIFGLVGIKLLSNSFASGPSNSMEAESGTLSQCTVRAQDTNASAGTYVIFGSSPCSATTGELKQWHKVTLTFEGPATSETAIPNPFSDYRLDVTFTNGQTTYTVPGYYAADGNAANTSASEGNKWLVHFTPDKTGTWSYSVSFKSGSDIAINSGGSSAQYMDGQQGTFAVTASDKSGDDNRARGMLKYVNNHYLQFAGDKSYFIKAGADSPENMLAYDDFDSTPNAGSRRKSWAPHAQDYNANDASGYTWANGKGTELLGAINYLSSVGMNAFSFLTLSISGDDDNVYPHLQKSANAIDWTNVHHDRFDVSKMAQWDRIFEYGDKKGMYLHFKTLETENDNAMDSNTFGRERKLYYRELIARFGYHLALNWNISEEVTLSTEVIKASATYIKQVDPYDHNIVVHTYPGDTFRYTPLTGNQSDLTGASMQISIDTIHNDITKWVNNSAAANKKWVVANDEQGSANIGIHNDPNERDKVRTNVLWGTLMAGGAGVEYYYGYQTSCTDLTCQDHRTRSTKWQDAAIALGFFRQHLPFWEMVSNDSRTSNTNDYVFEKSGSTYAIYLSTGGTTNINLSGVTGTFTVQWFNPRTGGNLQNGSVTSVAGGGNRSIGNPPNNTSSDWVALIKQ